MTKQINVGFNGSASSAEAVQWAAAEASSRGARLRLISCYLMPIMPGVGLGLTPSDAYSSVLNDTQDNLVHLQAVIDESHPDLEITTLVSADPAASVLIDGVVADDLVVVGTSDHQGAAGFWLGSTARHVVRHSPCPVVVVPGPSSRGHTDRIVVGVDGSPTSRQALLWAGDQADRNGAKLLIIHGWMYPYMHADPDSAQVRDLTKVDAACLLDREVEAAREQFGADITGRLVECGPSAALLGTVRQGDVLVLGSNGHGAIHSTLFGSTVNTVLDHCTVPTVIVRKG
jgi:nucleotide-binding universal stress UspA family protein